MATQAKGSSSLIVAENGLAENTVYDVGFGNFDTSGTGTRNLVSTAIRKAEFSSSVPGAAQALVTSPSECG